MQKLFDNLDCKKAAVITAGLSALLTSILLVILFLVNGLVPFGDRSFASWDAQIQYLDFFAYFKDVLAGQNSIDYSMTKGLGGSELAVFSYHLASPFNLLVVFFAKEDLVSFFDLIVALKIVTASVTCAIFLTFRFKREESDAEHIVLTALLAVSYALCQYTIAQSSNIMWLDGVYMLPLILLGVWRTVNFKNPAMLIICVALSILFNWYTGAINCLFACVWFFVEYFLAGDRRTVKHFFKTGFFFGFTMLAGVLLSCVLLLPTIGVLSLGPRGSLGLRELLDSHMLGYALSFFDSYSIGATSSKANVSIYAGCLPAIFCFAAFLSKQISKRTKIVLGALIAFIIAAFYWSSLYFVFSLFSSVHSYFCRFSYVGAAAIAFIAALYISKVELKKEAKTLAVSAIVFVCLLLFSHVTTHTQSGKYALLTCAVAIIVCALLIAILRFGSKSNSALSALLLLVVCVSCADVTASASSILHKYASPASENNGYVTHSIKMDKITSDIKSDHDGDSPFRVSQAAFRLTDEKTGLAANFNDSMAYNFSSIVSYTSSSFKSETSFLESVGFAFHGNCMNIEKDPIASVDSLLGAQYVIANRSYPHLTNALEEVDDTTVYKNPYAFPLAFTYSKDSTSVKVGKEAAAFDVQNEIFEEISGEGIAVFKDLDAKLESEVEGTTSTTTVSVDVPEGNFAIYAYARIANQPLDVPARLSFADGVEYDYQCWLSPAMFYVPISDDSTATFDVSFEGLSTDIDFSSLRVCALDLDALQKVSDIANSNAAEVTQTSGSQFTIHTVNDEATNVLFTIPYDKNWNVTVNGERVSQEQYGEGLTSIPVPAGEVEIQMRYRVPNLTKGICCSLAGLALSIGLIMISRRNGRHADQHRPNKR